MKLLSVGEAVRRLRQDPQYAAVIRDSYLDGDVQASADRFLRSAEFREVQRLLGQALPDAVVLDVGAGRGVSAFAFAHAGAGRVFALDPDPSDDIGLGALARLTAGLQVEPLAGFGEEIPLPDDQVDIVYARQVLHHATDLPGLVAECQRVLRPGGIFLACREHVVDDAEQLEIFLAQHPVHALAGGENAHPLDAYVRAIVGAGLELERVLGPWDSIINAFPSVRSREELEGYPARLLEQKFGAVGRLLAAVPPVRWAVWRRIDRPVPGRMYSFLAVKPPARQSSGRGPDAFGPVDPS